MAAEKDCLFPAKAVLLKAKKVWKQSERYLLKDRGHEYVLSNSNLNKDKEPDAQTQSRQTCEESQLVGYFLENKML